MTCSKSTGKRDCVFVTDHGPVANKRTQDEIACKTKSKVIITPSNHKWRRQSNELQVTKLEDSTCY